MLSLHLSPVPPPALFFFVERHVRQLEPHWATSKLIQPAPSLADKTRGERSFSFYDLEIRVSWQQN